MFGELSSRRERDAQCIHSSAAEHWSGSRITLGKSRQSSACLASFLALSMKCRSTHVTGEDCITHGILEESYVHHFLLLQSLDGPHLTPQWTEWLYSAASSSQGNLAFHSLPTKPCSWYMPKSRAVCKNQGCKFPAHSLICFIMGLLNCSLRFPEMWKLKLNPFLQEERCTLYATSSTVWEEETRSLLLLMQCWL